MSTQKIRQPRELGGRDEEKWRDEVSRRVSNAQPAESNESLLWLMHEDRNAEPVKQISDIDSLQSLVELIPMDGQISRDTAAKARDLEVNIQAITYSEQMVRDTASKLKGLEIIAWMGV